MSKAGKRNTTRYQRRQAEILERKNIRDGLKDEQMRRYIMQQQQMYFKMGYQKCMEDMATDDNPCLAENVATETMKEAGEEKEKREEGELV